MVTIGSMIARGIAAFAPWRQHGLGIFPDLLGRLEDLLERPTAIVFAIIGRVFAADLGAIEIDAAAVVAPSGTGSGS